MPRRRSSFRPMSSKLSVTARGRGRQHRAAGEGRRPLRAVQSAGASPSSQLVSTRPSSLSVTGSKEQASSATVIQVGGGGVRAAGELEGRGLKLNQLAFCHPGHPLCQGWWTGSKAGFTFVRHTAVFVSGVLAAQARGASLRALVFWPVLALWRGGACVPHTQRGAVRQRPIRTQPTQRKRVVGITVGRLGRIGV